MQQKLEGRGLELVKDKNHATLATLRRDGSVQAVIVWADADDEGQIVVNSAVGRAWPANLRRTGHATLMFLNRDDPMEFVSVTADLASATTDDGEAVIHALSRKYMGMDYPWLTPGEQRITLRLRPRRVVHRRAG